MTRRFSFAAGALAAGLLGGTALPVLAQDRAALMDQHRGGTMRLVARSAAGTNSAIAAFYYLRLVAAPLLESPDAATRAAAPTPFFSRPLAALVARLADFIHPSLRFHNPKAFWVRGREQALAGGCKPWTLPLPLEQVTSTGAGATWEQLRDWPHGADPASVCVGDRRYAVWFKPLLPGEQP